MRNFKLTVEYEGTDFSGWQIQPDRRTVAGELVLALEDCAAAAVKLVGAGRTDAGVHAVGQVANALLDTKLAPDAICRAVNARLPHDIIVRGVAEVGLSFNARRDARCKMYHYIFMLRPTALWRRYFTVVAGGLDVRAMRGALRAVVGERDFTSFASSADTCSTKRCHVIRADLIEAPPMLTLSITADHFLHNMVRSLAGTLLEIGKGKPWNMEEIIGARDRTRAGPTLPPHALYLMEVQY